MSKTDVTTLDPKHPCYRNPNVLLRVDEVGFEIATQNILQAEGIYYMGQLIGISYDGFVRRAIPQIGTKRRNEIKEVVAELGLQLGISTVPLDCNTREGLAEFYGVSKEGHASVLSPLFMMVALPKDMVAGQTHDAVVAKIKDICQWAFAVAVKLDVLSPHPPTTPIDVIRSVNPSIRSIQINTGKPTTSFLVPLTAPFHEAVIYKPAFLKGVAERIGGEFLHSLLAPKLQG